VAALVEAAGEMHFSIFATIISNACKANHNHRYRLLKDTAEETGTGLKV